MAREDLWRAERVLDFGKTFPKAEKNDAYKSGAKRCYDPRIRPVHISCVDDADENRNAARREEETAYPIESLYCVLIWDATGVRWGNWKHH